MRAMIAARGRLAGCLEKDTKRASWNALVRLQRGRAGLIKLLVGNLHAASSMACPTRTFNHMDESSAATLLAPLPFPNSPEGVKG